MHLEQLDNLWENSGVDQIFCRIAVLHAIAKGCPMADVKAQNALAVFPTAKEVMEQNCAKGSRKSFGCRERALSRVGGEKGTDRKAFQSRQVCPMRSAWRVRWQSSNVLQTTV